MAVTNYQTTFNADVENYIQGKVLPLTQRQLVAYQFGDKLELPKGRGLTYTASRYDRVNLPIAPLSEGQAPTGQGMSLAQVSATVQQWGDTITLTDVADMTIKHPLFEQATNLISLQMAETMERNTFNALMAGTQVNYVNSRGARASLVAGDVLNLHEINRAAAYLYTVGAPQFNGQTENSKKVDADRLATSSSDPRGQQHYVALMHPLPEQDVRENSTVTTAWSYSDVNRLYNNEIGQINGIRFTRSNMVPYYTGVAAVNGSAGTAGSLATGTYYVQVTGSVTQNGYEQRVYQVSSSVSVTGPNGSISVTLPSVTGFTFNVYVGTTSSPANLGVCATGPTTGAYAGQAVNLTGGSAVVITGVGVARTPPAAPATGVTVYPTFIVGKNAYGQVTLDAPKIFYNKDSDKSDPLNQLRVIGWKTMYGTIILNQTFFMRVESTSGSSATLG
jgi:N4-gp56 family major capsid protein